MKSIAATLALLAFSAIAQAGMFSDGAWESVKLKFADVVYTEKAVIQASNMNAQGATIYILKTDTTYYRCVMDFSGSECWRLKSPEEPKK